MTIFRWLLLTLLMLPAHPAALRDVALEKSVSGLAGLLTDGYAELDQAPLLPVRSSDVVAVLFNLQGPGKGNGMWQFLAFFEANSDDSPELPAASPYRLLGYSKVGSKGTRLFDDATARFRRSEFSAHGAAFKPSDTMCCPSQPIDSVFVIENEHVVERQLGN